ncbi:hypothetical protein ACFLT9_02785 [Acidobacteriota bacterium]
MKKLNIAAVLLCAAITVYPQGTVQEESLVVNIEIPVRVFDGDRFVDDLKIGDFEIYENGIPQKVDAVYLINKRTIERSEEKKKFLPETTRDFYLYFEITEYLPRLGEALEYFIENVFFPGDHLTVVTPLKTYRLKDKTFEHLSKKEVIDQLQRILKKDAMIGSAEYRSTVRDLTGLAKAATANLSEEYDVSQKQDQFDVGNYLQMPLNVQLSMYANLLKKLDGLRSVDQNQLMSFAESMKKKPGQKYVFLFYQREFIPEIEPRILNQYLTMHQEQPDVVHTISNLFDFYTRHITFNVDLIKKAYSDSSISMHFLFVTRPPEVVSGIRFDEHSEDIYAAFKEMALATGGYTDSSSNPNYLFRKAIEMSENYYLLYYAPENFVRDGQFKDVEVRIKRSRYRISHRLGYFAN